MGEAERGWRGPRRQSGLRTPTPAARRVPLQRRLRSGPSALSSIPILIVYQVTVLEKVIQPLGVTYKMGVIVLASGRSVMRIKQSEKTLPKL